MVLEQSQSGAFTAVQPAPVAAAPARPVQVAASPCLPPAGTGPFQKMPHPISTQSVNKPLRALAEHVSGCGGVRFRIGPYGEPEDVTVMAEYPLGYGFGETVRQMIVTSRWAPRDDLSWHYLDATIRTTPG